VYIFCTNGLGFLRARFQQLTENTANPGSIPVRRRQLRKFRSLAIAVHRLAALGVYGLVSYSVTQRTAEFGIRAALGASRRDLIRLVMTYCLRLAGIGILVGLAGILLLSRLIASFLYGIPSFDPATFAGAAFLLLVIGLAAASGPAIRAAQINTVDALRSE